MLNDAACFKAVYIVCGYTDLLLEWIGWQHWWKHKRETDLMYRIPFTFSADGAPTASRDWYGKGMDGSCYIRGCQKAVSNGRATRRKCVP